MLAVIEMHPVQYRGPIYRTLQRDFDVPVTAIYATDEGVAGYRDAEFGTDVAWDTDLLSGYTPVFLSRSGDGHGEPRACLGDAMRSAKPRAVLVVGYHRRYHQRGIWNARSLRCPILFRAETTDHARRRGALKTWARDEALRWLYARCDALLYIGERSRRHFLRLRCPENKLYFSPYGVDTDPFRPSETDRASLRRPARSSLDVSEETRLILFSGKLVPRKGPELLLAAVKAMPSRERRETVVAFLGDGEMRGCLEAFAKSEPTVHVRFLGFRNQTELSSCFHAADVLALPSRHSETWGLVVNEALHHGVPVVVTRAVGCAPDLVEPGVTGEIAETDSTESLSGALERVLALRDDPATRKRCRDKVEGYTVTRAAEGIARAYRCVLGLSASDRSC